MFISYSTHTTVLLNIYFFNHIKNGRLYKKTTARYLLYLYTYKQLNTISFIVIIAI